jgi:hypothetical protein
MYVDSHFHYAIWVDIYDSNLKLWKIFWNAPRAETVPQVGHVTTNSTTGAVWDVQNEHMTMVSTVDPAGVGPKFNQDAPPDYHDYNKYCTPGGLIADTAVMRKVKPATLARALVKRRDSNAESRAVSFCRWCVAS